MAARNVAATLSGSVSNKDRLNPQDTSSAIRSSIVARPLEVRRLVIAIVLGVSFNSNLAEASAELLPDSGELATSRREMIGVGLAVNVHDSMKRSIDGGRNGCGGTLIPVMIDFRIAKSPCPCSQAYSMKIHCNSTLPSQAKCRSALKQV